MNDWVPCFAGGVVFLIVFSFLAYTRYLRHKEVMMLAEKGLSYPEPRRNGKDTLRWGIGITAVGLALLVGIAPMVWVRAARSTMAPDVGASAWPMLLIGLLPTFFGVALILIYVLTREEKPVDEPQAAADAQEALEEPLE
jgi:hypothetical protein